MKRFAAVALREIVERRFVLVAAAAAAVVPFLVPLLPGVPGDDAGTARSVAALILACTFGLGGALLVGASVASRELAERRLSFHFARPLSGTAIWGGKLVGGLVLVLLAEMIVYLPASAVSGLFPGLLDAFATRAVWAVHLLAVPVFLAAWVGSVSLRSRSPWLVVDLVLLVTLPALLFVIGRRVLRFGGWFGPADVLTAVAIALLAAGVAATCAQVVVGRTDAKRGHGAQSLTLWGLLLAATGIGFVLAERAINPGVSRLVHAGAEIAGSGGDWVFVGGKRHEEARGDAVYALNLRDGRSRRISAHWSGVVSADGTRAAYAYETLLPRRRLLEALDLATGRAVTMDLTEWPQGLDLSADGRRLAVVSGELCRVLELPSLRLLASARLPFEEWTYAPRFVTPDVVRLHPSYLRSVDRARDRREGDAIEDPLAADLDVSSRSLKPLATYRLGPLGVPVDKSERYPIPRLVLGPNGSSVLATGHGSLRGVGLFDAASGRLLATVDGVSDPGKPSGAFLADGRVVLSEPSTEGRRLVLLSPDGVRLSEIPLPGAPHFIRFGPEPGKGLLCIGLAGPPGTSSDRTRWYITSLADGTLRPLADLGLEWPVSQGSHRFSPPGSPATRLALEKDTGRLVLFDPATGATKPLTRGHLDGK